MRSKCVVLAALGVVALLPTAAAASQQPKRASATGTITVLSGKRIAVHGRPDLTCKLGVGSAGIVHGFVLGSRAKITCLDGILAAIVRSLGAHGTTGSAGVASSSSVSTSSSTSSASVSTSSTSSSSSGGAKTSQSVSAAIGPISALAAGSITVGSISCSLGTASPDTSGFKVGDRVTLRCENGTLTALSHAA